MDQTNGKTTDGRELRPKKIEFGEPEPIRPTNLYLIQGMRLYQIDSIKESYLYPAGSPQ